MYHLFSGLFLATFGKIILQRSGLFNDF